MTTIQEWLNEKYPTREEKERVAEIDAKEISQKWWEQNIFEDGTSKKLEGGELDLTEYPNLYYVNVDRSFLKTPLTKLTLGG